MQYEQAIPKILEQLTTNESGRAEPGIVAKLKESGIGKVEILSQASAHPRKCKCDLCLAWWVLVGPEEEGSMSGWSFGPFTQDEFVAAGGTIPDQEEGDHDDEDNE